MNTAINAGNAEKGNRVVFLDWLRIIACFMVMAIHAAEPFYLGGETPNITFREQVGRHLDLARRKRLPRVRAAVRDGVQLSSLSA